MDVLHLVTATADFRTYRDDKPTLLVSWWCTVYAIAIIVIRFCGRYVRAEKVFLEDAIMMLAITPLIIRMVFVHFVLKNGTNNTITDGLSSQDISRRELGSQLVLAARAFYAAYLWAIKFSTTLFLKTLTESVFQRSHKRLLLYLHIFLGATFIATIIADLGACHPFSHYWQVVPDPGPSCRSGAAQLYTMGALNIITNIALIIFPIPMILRSKISRSQKISILLRLALPLTSIGFTLYSLPQITFHNFSQQRRSLLASIDILLSTFTSNSVVLFSLLADRGYKKTKYKFNPHAIAGDRERERKGSLARKGGSMWGSDEDLIDGKGGTSIGLRDLGADGEGKRGKSLRRPKEVKLGDIRVNSTWEIRVDDKD